MDVGIAELVKHVTKLVERAEHGEEIVITRHGRAVAKLTPPESPKQKRQFGALKGKIKLNAGWNEPLPLEMWEVHASEPSPKPTGKEGGPKKRKAHA